MLSLSFDPESLATLVRMAGFKVLLDEEIKAALTEAGSTLTQAAQANTWTAFTNPTGALSETIYPWLASPSQMEIRVDSPYGARREYGYSGQTDSLGRFFANDPAKPYLQPALDEHLEEVQAIMTAAVSSALNKLGGT